MTGPTCSAAATVAFSDVTESEGERKTRFGTARRAAISSDGQVRRTDLSPDHARIAEDDLDVPIVISQIMADLIVASSEGKERMTVGKGDKPCICQPRCAGDEMALCDSDIDQSIREFLGEDLPHLPRWKIGITGDDSPVLFCQGDERPVMSGIHVLRDISFLSHIARFHNLSSILPTSSEGSPYQAKASRAFCRSSSVILTK